MSEALERDQRLALQDVYGGDFDLRRIYLQYFWEGRANIAAQRPLLGYEVRDPLGDLRLVEFLLALSPDQYFRDGVQRRFARHLLADRMPKEVLWSPARGRQCGEWFHRLNRRRGPDDGHAPATA